MRTLGTLTVFFAAFWLIVPGLVVRMRINKRRKQNAARYSDWKRTVGEKGIQPLPRKIDKLALRDGELVYLHEKGTLYVPARVGFDEISAKGKPGDVAFPRFRQNCRKIQRTHCYFTDKRIIFVGKALKFEIDLKDLKAFVDTPGGVAFTVMKDNRRVALAFTFQNPLVAAEYLKKLTSLDDGVR